MKIYLDPYFIKKHKKIIKKNPNLKKIIKNKLKMFQKNPQHPSLKLHKISGGIEEWSISVKKDLRIIFQYVKGGILLVDFGPHNEVY